MFLKQTILFSELKKSWPKQFTQLCYWIVEMGKRKKWNKHDRQQLHSFVDSRQKRNHILCVQFVLRFLLFHLLWKHFFFMHFLSFVLLLLFSFSLIVLRFIWKSCYLLFHRVHPVYELYTFMKGKARKSTSVWQIIFKLFKW